MKTDVIFAVFSFIFALISVLLFLKNRNVTLTPISQNILLITLLVAVPAAHASELNLRCKGTYHSQFGADRAKSIDLTVDLNSESVRNYESEAKLIANAGVYPGLEAQQKVSVTSNKIEVIDKLIDHPNNTDMTWILEISRVDGEATRTEFFVENGTIIPMGKFIGICRKYDERKF